MILFLEDWAKYPTAIADTKTTNESFLRMAQMYKQLGVKNHAFMLALLQPELQGVDPFADNLTQDQCLMIALECKWNPWYFFREVLRIPVQGLMHPVRFKANRGNLALYFTFFCNIDVALIQPRQTGKSVSTDGLMIWLTYIGTQSTDIMMMTKDNDLRKKNIERLKEIRDALPPYLLSISKLDSDNQIELTCKAKKNSYRTVVGQNSEDDANKAGRGWTSPVMQIDEGPFIKFIDVSIPAAAAAGTAARTAAEQYGLPYGNIFTTTAGKLDTREGKFMYDMIFGGAVWDERYCDVKDRYAFRKLIDNLKTGMRRIINATFSHRQLGYSDAWLVEAISNANGDPDSVERDFMNVWTAGSMRSPIPLELIKRIHASQVDPLHVEITKDLFVLNWYMEEKEIANYTKNNHIIWGLDTSDAVGRDAISLVGVDAATLETVAVSRTNLSNLYVYAQFLVELLVRYKNSTLVIERKSSAQSIIDYCCTKLPMYKEDPFQRLYNRCVEERANKPEWDRLISMRLESRSDKHYDSVKNQFGFNTTAESRHLLYSNVLMNAAKMAGHAVRDRGLSSEIFGLVERNGRIDHARSGHDDTVIAWLMTHWFARFAKNTTHYGIPKGFIMALVTETGSEMTEEEYERRREEEEAMQEIDMLLEELKGVSDYTTKALLTHRIKHLSRKLTDSNSTVAQNVTELLEQGEAEYLKRQRMASFGERLSFGY